MNPIALLDANVLYPAPLRDLLMRLAVADFYDARWTDEIHREWTRNLAANRPDLTPPQISRTLALMNQHLPDANITGYEQRIPTLTLPDPSDRHILAAAIQSGATVIVTSNLKDFPASALTLHGIIAQSPDAFICSLYNATPEDMLNLLREHRLALKNPPKTPEQYLETLTQNALKQFVALIAPHQSRL